jgi:hypothetical protein
MMESICPHRRAGFIDILCHCTTETSDDRTTVYKFLVVVWISRDDSRSYGVALLRRELGGRCWAVLEGSR